MSFPTGPFLWSSPMRRSLLCLTLACPALALAQTTLTPPAAPARPVTDTYFGTAVVDPYRWMETSSDELLAYMKAENAVTQEALKPFATQNAQILSELTKLSETVASVVEPNRILDQYFYLELPTDKSDYRLMTRAVSGGDARVLLDPTTLAEGGKHAAIDYFVPSPNGASVIVGVSLGGSENSVLHVIDVASGKLMDEAHIQAYGWGNVGANISTNTVRPGGNWPTGPGSLIQARLMP